MDAPERRVGAGVARKLGRYALHDAIAAGGMAIVHLGRLLGPVGFARTVAIKRMHPNLAHDRDFVAMFVDEARVAARIHHPNVVSILDVVVEDGEVLLVMEYVHGESLARLLARSQETQPLSLPVCSAIVTGVLHGLHAAHEAVSERGEPLGLVHRDVSPQNVLVGADGVARVLDFGVAKAQGRLQTTREGRLKGKLAYMTPEQLLNETVTRATDIYAASVVAWEMVTGKRLLKADNEGAIVQRILNGSFDAPSKFARDVPESLDRLILRGLSQDPAKRFATAHEMALALEACIPPALPSEVAGVVAELAGDALKARANVIAEMESSHSTGSEPVSRELDQLGHAGDAVTESQLSIHADFAPAPTPKLRRALWPALAAAGLVLGIAVASMRMLPSRSGAAETAAASVQSVAPATSAPVNLAAEPPSAVPAAAEPTPSASVSSAAPAATSKPRVRTAPAKKRGCDPPYTIDSIGRRIYKRECF